MEHIFIETPVSVRCDAGRLVLLDAQGVPVVDMAGGDALLQALLQDVRRRMNAGHEMLMGAVRPLPVGWRLGVQAEWEEGMLGRWWAALGRPAEPRLP